MKTQIFMVVFIMLWYYFPGHSQYSLPLVVLVHPLAVSVCPLVVFFVASVGLFISDQKEPIKIKLWGKNYENKTANKWAWNIFSWKQQFMTCKYRAWVYNLKIKSKPKCRSSQRKCSRKKAVLKNFAYIHRKAIVLEPLFNKVVGLQVLRTPTLKNTWERVLKWIFKNLNISARCNWNVYFRIQK